MAVDADPQALIEALAIIPGQLEDAVQRLPANQRTAGEGAENEWTPSEVAGHLCDSARYWGARMRRVAREDQPGLELFDENQLIRLAAYMYRPVDELLREFRIISAGNVAFLRGLPPDAWERSGIHETRGAITLREIVAIEADHERNHVEQFQRALAGA